MVYLASKICQNWMEGGVGAKLLIDWREREVVRVGRQNFLILKKIQFACSQIKLLYLDHGALKNRPTSRAAWKLGESVSLQGQSGNHRFAFLFGSVCTHVIVFLIHWWVVCRLLFLCCCIFVWNLWLIKHASVNISGPF